MTPKEPRQRTMRSYINSAEVCKQDIVQCLGRINKALFVAKTLAGPASMAALCVAAAACRQAELTRENFMELAAFVYDKQPAAQQPKVGLVPLDDAACPMCRRDK